MNEDSRLQQKSQLKDIRSVIIDTSLPVQERVRSYVRQIGDPYRFLVGDVVVNVSYSGDRGTLSERFSEMLSLME